MTREQKALILTVVGVLNTTRAVSTADVHRQLPDAEIEDIGSVLAILRSPDVNYRRGKIPEKVLARVLEVLAGETVEDTDPSSDYVDDRV